MKRYFTSVFLLVLLISIAFNASALRADIITKNLPEVQAGSYVIYDADTNEVLFGKKYTIVEQPAEVAQIITALIALEKGTLTDKVTVPRLPSDIEYPNRLYLDEGEELSLESLIEGVIIYNANDAAYAIALHIGKSQEEFLKMMNAKAKEIGMKDTSFQSVYGYHKDQKTTTLDMAKLAGYVVKNSNYVKYANRLSMNWTSNLFSKNNIPNVNVFKDILPESIGIKYVDAKNGTYGFIAGAELEKRHIVGVICESTNRDGLASAMSDLLQLGADGTERQKIVGQNDLVTILNYSETKSLKVVAGENYHTTMATNMPSNLTQKTTINKVTLPVEKGEKIGVLSIYSGKDKVKDIPLVASEAVKKDKPKKLIIFLLVLLVMLLLFFYRKLSRRKRRIRRVRTKNTRPTSRNNNHSKKNVRTQSIKTKKNILPPKEDKSSFLKKPSLGSSQGRKKIEERIVKKGKM